MKKYDNFFLPVDDLDAARAFYAQTLDLPLKFDFSAAGMVAYRVGSEEPAIILKDKARFPDAKPTIWFEVDDARKTCAQLQARGISFLSEPFHMRTGWAAEFEDPSGNHLGVTDYLPE